MERIDGGWDDILSDILPLNGDVLGTPNGVDGLRAYDIDFTSALSWSGKNVCALLLIATAADSWRQDYHQTLHDSIGSPNNFQLHSPNSANSSSPAISDYLMFAPDDLRRFSHSTVSSEGTISPKDSILSSPMLPEIIGYFAKPAAYTSASSRREDATSLPLIPISPQLVMPSIAPAASPKLGKEPVEAAPAPGAARRRASTKPTAVSKESTKAGTTSNHNNSKPMTARDRKRRQMHNASAMRSRIRLNETLDKMWKTIPAARRRKRLGEDTDEQEVMEDTDDEDDERIGRADKVEIGIAYIHYLEQRVQELEERINPSH